MIFDRPLPIADLCVEKALLTLASGFVVTGTVRDGRGSPLGGTLVTSWTSDNDIVQVRADSQGVFRFENRPPGLLSIMVETAGFAPDARTLRLRGPRGNAAARSPRSVPGPGADFAFERPNVDATQLEKNGECRPPLEFKLAPGRTVRGRVVDHKGNPAPVRKCCQKVSRFLDAQLSWNGVTDASGGFEWEECSARRDQGRSGGAGQSRTIEAKCNPTDRPVLIQLPAPFPEPKTMQE